MADRPKLQVVGGTAAQAAKDFYLPTSEVDRLAQEFASNRHMAKLDPIHVRNLIQTAAHRKGAIPELKDVHEIRRSVSSEIVKPKPIDPVHMQALQAQIKANEAAEKARSASRHTGSSFHQQILDQVEQQHAAMQKTAAGMGFVMAALFAIGALSNFQNAKKKDENGEERIQLTQVGVGILMAALSVGTAAVSHSGWKAASAAAR